MVSHMHHAGGQSAFAHECIAWCNVIYGLSQCVGGPRRNGWCEKKEVIVLRDAESWRMLSTQMHRAQQQQQQQQNVRSGLLYVSTLTVVSSELFGRVGCVTTQVTSSSSCRRVGKRRLLLRVEVPLEWVVSDSSTVKGWPEGGRPPTNQLIWGRGLAPTAEHDTDWWWEPFMISSWCSTWISGRTVK